MSWIDAARTRARLLFTRRAAESRMDEEIGFHIDMEADRLAHESGLDRKEARRRALATFGGVQRYREELREGRGLAWLGGMSVDLRLGARLLRKNPGLTIVAGLALAVAIGAGAAWMEFVNDLYHPTLPFPQGERLVGIQNWDAESSEPENRVVHDFLAWREHLRTIEGVGAGRALTRNLVSGDGRAEPVRGVEISASIFPLVQVRPILGRTLIAEDERADAPPVVLIGHDLWQSRFGGDSAVVGRTVRLGKSMHTVVGVMPEGFGFPSTHSLWVPLRLDGRAWRRGEGPVLRVFGRLAPGATLASAQAELTAIARRLAADAPESPRELRPVVRPYVESLLLGDAEGELERLILYLANLFFLGLLGLCGANVATLVFARTASREAELTVRTALGAGRGRLVAQLFAEALVLSSLAALVGVAGAAIGTRSLKQLLVAAGNTPPFWWDDRLSSGTVLYAVVLTLLAAVLVGIVPALKATGNRLQDRLRAAASGGSSAPFGRLWTGVIVAQVAITALFLFIVVLVGWNVRAGGFGATPLSIATGKFLSARLEFDREDGLLNGDEDAATEAAFRARTRATLAALRRRLESEPAVEAVTLTSRLPGKREPATVQVEGIAPPLGGGAGRWMGRVAVDDAFIPGFGVAVVSGRSLTPADFAAGRHVAVVDQTFVRLVVGGRDPLGMRFRDVPEQEGAGAAGPWYEIVGVVRDVTVRTDKGADEAVTYRADVPDGGEPLYLAVRLRGEPSAFAPRLGNLAVAIDPTLRLTEMRPMRELGEEDRVAMRFLSRALVILGALALLLATAGIYSLMSFTVARRTREIGIRAAIGASPRRVVAGVFARAFRQLGVGVLAGSVPGIAVVTLGAPEVANGGGVVLGGAAFLAVTLFMVTVGLLASAVPMRRALRIQPTEALRSE